MDEIVVSHKTVMRIVSKMPSLDSDNFEDAVSKLLDFYELKNDNMN
jgi:hypothetical protein